MSLAGIYSFLYQLPYALQGILIGATDLRLQMNTEDFFLLPKSPLTTFAVGISFFYLFYLVFFFIAISQKKSLFVKIGLLIGSLSYIVSGMAFTTRDVLIFYIFGYLFVYLYFKNLISTRSRQKLRWLYITFGALLLALLLLFSYQRFTSGSIDKLAYGTVGYMAQQPFVFSETLEMQTEYYGGSLRFPIFVALIDKKVDIERTSPYEWSFGTFIKDFYATGGFPFLIIVTLIFVPFFLVKIRNSKKSGFYRNLIVVLFYFQFMTMGVFYFKLGSRPGNIYMIMLLIFYFMTYFRFGERRRIEYE
jgi:oligosaccharide repeat unit polymerase